MFANEKDGKISRQWERLDTHLHASLTTTRIRFSSVISGVGSSQAPTSAATTSSHICISARIQETQRVSWTQVYLATFNENWQQPPFCFTTDKILRVTLRHLLTTRNRQVLVGLIWDVQFWSANSGALSDWYWSVMGHPGTMMCLFSIVNGDLISTPLTIVITRRDSELDASESRHEQTNVEQWAVVMRSGV